MMTATLVDAHAHLQPVFDVERFLDAAAVNVRCCAERLGLPADEAVGCLLLADDASFTQCRRLRTAPALARWRITPGEEPTSLHARVDGDGAPPLVIVAGRQVVTAERLEVLAVNTLEAFAEGEAFDDTLRCVVSATGQAIVPWGAGKWLGARGRLVARALGRMRDGQVLLGDNAARPRGVPRPALFREARRRGVAILPGSDPLPLPAELASVGSFGFMLAGPLCRAAPGRDLASRLQRLTHQPRAFGRRKSLLMTTRRQLQLRMNGR